MRAGGGGVGHKTAVSAARMYAYMQVPINMYIGIHVYVDMDIYFCCTDVHELTDKKTLCVHIYILYISMVPPNAPTSSLMFPGLR